MSKYDYKIDLSENSSTGLILKKIRQGSTVLEFGCATGRMTKYMQEKLHCQVYIVEIDREAYETAVKYAADGVCGDIMDMEWKEKFSDIRFDHILFADVLEHLPDPDNVIREASQLLVPDGNIIFSVPNITHNDIILKAVSDHFDYTDVGLLDNTHIHFWGLENIRPFAKKNSLYIHNIEATYCETGCTEQYKGDLSNIPPLLLNILSERLCGTVYQFVVTAALQVPENDISFSSDKKGIVSHIYTDLGQGFSEENKIGFRTKVSEGGRYIVHYVIENTENIRRIRFDPIEYQSCILQNISVRRGGKQLPYIYSDHIVIENGLLLKGPDPIILIEDISGSGPVVIDADLTIPGEAYVRMIEDICFNDRKLIQNERDAFTTERRRLEDDLKRIETEKAELISQNDRRIDELISQNDRRIDELNRSSEAEKAAIISDYSEKVSSLENAVSELNNNNTLLKDSLNSLNAEIAEKDKQLSFYMEKENEFCAKLHSYQQTVQALNKNAAETEKARAALEKENKGLKNDSAMYIKVINSKEELLIRKDREIAGLNEQLTGLNEQLAGMNAQIAGLNEQLAGMNEQISSKDELIAQGAAELCRFRNRKVVRFVDRIADILRKIKHFFIK